MFRLCLSALVACSLVGGFSQPAYADEPHEVWLKEIEGTWTWNDDVRGKVTTTLKLHAGGKCMVGTGKDDTGAFHTIIGWEAWSKSLTDTGFHSNGGGSRIVYNKVTDTELEGVRTGAGPDGRPLPEVKLHVVREGNTVTVTATEANGETTKNVLTKVSKK